MKTRLPDTSTSSALILFKDIRARAERTADALAPGSLADGFTARSSVAKARLGVCTLLAEMAQAKQDKTQRLFCMFMKFKVQATNLATPVC
mmetsp:Transcript_75882/g.118578  ORF Transcript_75882/g.118578 Transcript_75882/m.118578 type:complete len:91 (-) Transcript_75882:14-286(-)